MIMLPDDRLIFKLEPVETTSSVWLRIKEQLVWELSRLRELNDANIDPIETAILRGRIKQLKIFLTFGTDREAEETDVRE